MKTDLFRFLQHRSEIKLNRKVFVFIVCLVISFFSWLQINLSKNHVDTIPVKIDFVNLPKARFGVSKISDTLLVEVEANGYGLLKYKIKDISIDFKKLKRDDNSGSYYFLPNNFTKTIAKHMGENFKVLRAITDTLQFNTAH
ncbi:MAG: hypothetical protein HY840_03605 [Bacteroidetes bacterium]|nr:hypothetical protein [Bacteroidota bacterium]